MGREGRLQSLHLLVLDLLLQLRDRMLVEHPAPGLRFLVHLPGNEMLHIRAADELLLEVGEGVRDDLRDRLVALLSGRNVKREFIDVAQKAVCRGVRVEA